jgi:hypothetical protein
MNINDRIAAFDELGTQILSSNQNGVITKFWETLNSANIHNPWFTPDNCNNAIRSIAEQWLSNSKLTSWINRYPEINSEGNFRPKSIGVVMAGNIPFVGFHDMLSVLITGNKLIGKISSKDGGLMQALADLLNAIEPSFGGYIKLTDGKIENFDAIIATGGDNSSRYFEYYFGKYPHIIRKNRHSIGILTGNETKEDLDGLASDIFDYFGLGCRNVSKLLVPIDYKFNELIKSLEKHKDLINHNKYANNYEYHRALYLMNSIEHFDLGFALLKADENLGSPVGVIYYQQYENINKALNYIENNSSTIQCVVTSNDLFSHNIGFGNTQNPQLKDYADGIDTIDFLSSL